MKEQYIDLMERTLSAYTLEHIERYFSDVKRDGLSEHGFPRLTSNIGILIARGRRRDLTGLFCEMMDFCCHSFPRVKAANDFSVREVILCIEELEGSNAIPAAYIARWKEELASIEPYSCYSVIAKTPTAPVHNWALFTGVSEFYRQRMGLCNSAEIIDIQIATQLQWIDENGMYMDAKGEVHQPMVYDLVPRGLFAMLLHGGYRGQYYERIDEILRTADLHTLAMQSVTGELAFGGRSNQFIHNEAWVAAIFEYEAARYQREGDTAMAGKFKAAAMRALEQAWYWLNKEPIRHVKNRFPTETRHGCEDYAYFDKYMITAASFFYVAQRFCDDSIVPAKFDDSPTVWSTSEHFHKIFAKAGSYALEFDLNADPHYDASGLGRVHRYGAPSPLCMSVPCPGHPIYHVTLENPAAVSICTGVMADGEWKFAADGAAFEALRTEKTDRDATVELACRFDNGACVRSVYTVDGDGVVIDVAGEGQTALMLPAFASDGDVQPEIVCGEHALTIAYEGWVCRYTTDARIDGLDRMGANRNGLYRAFCAHSDKPFRVRIEIVKQA